MNSIKPSQCFTSPVRIFLKIFCEHCGVPTVIIFSRITTRKIIIENKRSRTFFRFFFFFLRSIRTLIHRATKVSRCPSDLVVLVIYNGIFTSLSGHFDNKRECRFLQIKFYGRDSYWVIHISIVLSFRSKLSVSVLPQL